MFNKYYCSIIALLVIFPLYGHIFNRQNDQEVQQFLTQFIKPNDLVFDVGANIGKKTRLYLLCGARIVCFEPQAICLEKLYTQFKNNPNVAIEAVGLSYHKGSEHFFECLTSDVGSTCSQSWINNSRYTNHLEWNKEIIIPVTTLDAMIEKYGLPHFCKIDVEGFELEVLQGLTQHIPYLSFEFHIERLDSVKKCLSYLQSIGYTSFNASIGERGIFISQQWLAKDTLIEVLQKELNSPIWQCIGGLWGDIYAS